MDYVGKPTVVSFAAILSSFFSYIGAAPCVLLILFMFIQLYTLSLNNVKTAHIL